MKVSLKPKIESTVYIHTMYILNYSVLDEYLMSLIHTRNTERGRISREIQSTA